MRRLGILLVAALPAFGYLHSTTSTGAKLHRADPSAIAYSLEDTAKAGLLNASGNVWITADSDVTGAVNAAFQTWSSVKGAGIGFAPLAIIPATPVAATSVGPEVIHFSDTPDTAKVINKAIAVTLPWYIRTSGELINADIVFSPAFQFSTTMAAGTYDIQAILTHELGHSLGAGHSGVLGATMFQYGLQASNIPAQLKDDDIAFAMETYGGSAGYGTIAGSMNFDGGGRAVRGALITAVNGETGVVVGGFSSVVDGTFSFAAPPGSYVITAEPLGAIVGPADVGQPVSSVDETFEPVVLGEATKFVVAAGQTTNLAIEVAAGVPGASITYAALASSSLVYSLPILVGAGGSTSIVVSGPGLRTVQQNSVRTFGPVTVERGSVQYVGSVDGRDTIAMTLTSAPRTTFALASLAMTVGPDTVLFSGGLELLPAPVTSLPGVTGVFSFQAGAVAPGEIVTVFGAGLGPASGIAGVLDASGGLATALHGVQVMFDGMAAPLFFVRGDQVNVEVPFEVAGRPTTSMTVSYAGVGSAPLTLQVAATAPDVLGFGLNQDGSRNSASRPAAKGSVMQFYATGLGVLDSGLGTGALAQGADQAMATLDAGFGGVQYAGAAPGFTGLDQINLSIPTDAASGSRQVQFTANGVAAKPVTIWIQ